MVDRLRQVSDESFAFWRLGVDRAGRQRVM